MRVLRLKLRLAKKPSKRLQDDGGRLSLSVGRGLTEGRRETRIREGRSVDVDEKGCASYGRMKRATAAEFSVSI